MKLNFQHETISSSHLPHFVPWRAQITVLELLSFPFVEDLEDFQ